MSKVHIEDTSFSSIIETVDSKTVTRSLNVTGLSGSPTSILDTASKLPGVPKVCDAHPTIAGLVAVEVKTKPIGGNDASIVVRYEQPGTVGAIGGSTIEETGGFVERVRTNTDFKGELIQVSFDQDTQSGEVTIDVPRHSLRVTRRESSSPANAARFYVGKVNLGPFRGGGQRTWLMTSINGTTSDGGKTYIVTYEMFYNPDRWDASVGYRGADGRVPIGAKINRVKMYSETNFSALGINNIGSVVGGTISCESARDLGGGVLGAQPSAPGGNTPPGGIGDLNIPGPSGGKGGVGGPTVPF